MFQHREFTQVAISASTANNQFKPVILIPVYNHQDAITSTLENVLAYDIPIVLVDDGSNDECKNVLIALSQQYAEKVHLAHLSINSGKGAAVKKGFNVAFQLGYSHALQIDADGQHDCASIPMFLAKSAKCQQAIINGYPEYDHSVPAMRYYARYLTHVWVWINTLSLTIKDSMCGFRVYPLALITELVNSEKCGDRMSFDTEILVRWLWRDLPIINLATKVHYPENGVSHFQVWRDNALISWMHTRLFFGMLKRLPTLIARKISC